MNDDRPVELTPSKNPIIKKLKLIKTKVWVDSAISQLLNAIVILLFSMKPRRNTKKNIGAPGRKLP